MELIVISESKLKIMLSAPDMAYYELESTRVDCADAHTRAAFRHIFADARSAIGFDTAGERLLVQLYASREGGCEIFVTKLGAEEGTLLPPAEEETAPALPPPPAFDASDPEDADYTEEELELIRRLCDLDNHPTDCPEEADPMTYPTPEGASPETRLTQANRPAALVFDALPDLLAACRRLLRTGYGGRSTVYITQDPAPAWFLLLELPHAALSRLPRRYAFLSEYARELPAANLAAYLAEHALLIRKQDAVEVLGVL